MIFLLIILIFIILSVGYWRFSRDIFAPPVMKALVFLVSSVFVAINMNIWNVDISLASVVLISSGLLVYLVSSMFARQVFISSKKTRLKRTIKAKSYPLLRTSSFLYIVAIIYIAINFVIYYRYISQVSVEYGGDSGISTMLGYYRDAMVREQLQDPTYLVIMNLISATLSSFFLLIFANNYIQKVKNYKYLIPVLMYGLIMAISSSRIGFIYLVASISIITYLFAVRAKKEMNNKKIIRNVAIGIFLFFSLFIYLGSLTGKTQKQDSVFQNISIYTGSSIVAFDSFISNYEYDIKNFGTETLYGITNLARRLGVELNVTGSRFLEFRQLGDMSTTTNVYSSYRRLIHDYGYVGFYIIEMISGYFITIFYLRLRADQYKNFYLALLIYTFFFHTIVVSSIEEKLLVNLPTITTILTFAIYFALTRYFLKIAPRGYFKISKRANHAA